ncbi:MAG: amidohydrolase family protein [Cyanobium sp.]
MSSLTWLPPLRLPRCLLDPHRQDLPAADPEGLVAVCLQHSEGRLTAIQPAPEPLGALPLAITSPVDPHAHLDKVFTGEAFPNPEGSFAGAFAANIREHGSRTPENVQQRAERALELAWRHGLRAVRSHVDSLGPAAELSWEVLTSLRRRWRDRLELQLVALVPIGHWLTPQGQALAARVADAGGVLGGVVGPPFSRSARDGDALMALFRLAERHGCPIDLHIDEAAAAPGRGVQRLTRLLQRHRLRLPLVCSHASSMALLADRSCRRLAEAMAETGVGVVALPTTNLWLLDKRPDQTPRRRIQAPIRTLQNAGVTVAIGGDNVQDPWYPGGAFDPIELLRLTVLLSHSCPWTRLGLAPFTTAASRLLALEWDGVLRLGAPADLVVLGANSWREVLAQAPQRRVLRGGRWLPPPAAESPSPLLAALAAASPVAAEPW